MNKEKRNLCGVYFRMQADDGKFENICFSDMTEEQQDQILENRSDEWLKNLCKILGNTIRNIGDQFDIVAD